MITSKYFNMGEIVVAHGINEAMKENDRFAAEVNLSLQRYAVKEFPEIMLQWYVFQARDNIADCVDCLEILRQSIV